MGTITFDEESLGFAISVTDNKTGEGFSVTPKEVQDLILFLRVVAHTEPELKSKDQAVKYVESMRTMAKNVLDIFRKRYESLSHETYDGEIHLELDDA